MNLTAFSVRNHAFTLVMFAAAVALGIASFLNIPRSEDPTLEPPFYTIVAVYPGAAPADVEKLVVRPLEDAMKELDDIKHIDSEVRDGLGIISVAFKYGVNIDRSYDDVLRQVNQTRGSLPGGLARLDVDRFLTYDVAAVQLALVSPSATYAQLQDVAEELRQRVEAVPGVRRAEKAAFPKKQLRVSLQIERMQKLGLSVSEIQAALAAGNVDIPGGGAEAGARRLTVKTTGPFSSVDEVADTVLRADGSTSVRVRDVADVAWNYEEKNVFGRFNGERAMFVNVLPAKNENTIALRESIGRAVEAFRPQLPAGIRLEIGFDQSESLRRRLGRLGHDFLLAFSLVLVTVLPLGFRASLLVMLSIPLSLCLGFTLLLATGFTLNQLSIVGMVIALGLLVDDSIVVVENIARFRRQGRPPIEAAIEATGQITQAVIGTTAALLFAFLPLLVLPEGSGEFIRSLPVSVVYTVLASLLVSLTIIPFLASRVLAGRSQEEGNFFLRALTRVIHASYRPLLHWAMRHRLATVLGAAAIFLASLGLVPAIGFSLFPKAGSPVFAIRINGAEGNSVAETDRIALEVEAVLRTVPEVAWWSTVVGEGNAQVYYNEIPGKQQARAADIVVGLKGVTESTIPPVVEGIRKRVNMIAGAEIVVKEFQNGPPITAPVEVRVIGRDLDALARAGHAIEQILESIPGTMNVENPLRVRRTDLALRVNRARAQLLGVTDAEMDRMTRLAFAGLTAGQFREADGDEYDIQLVLPRGARATLENWPRLSVMTSAGQHVPMSQVATLEFESSPALISRHDRERAVTVSAFVREGYNTDRITRAVQRAIAEQSAIPAGCRYELGGEAESRAESFGGLGQAIIIAVFGILAILVLEFKSFRGTVVVASVIPLGVIGGLLALWLSGYTLSFMAAIGFVALIGIEIKNSILLVDFTNQLRAQGMALDAAIEQAGETRFLPVVLTTFTALGALLPLALQGSSLYSPLAIVIIGGLISSLLLSRLVTPVMYRMLQPATG